jgi:hypothetical protein
VRAGLIIPALAPVGAPIMFLQGAAYGFRPDDPDQLWGALELLYIFGWMTSIVALLRLGATWRSIGGRLILAIQLVCLRLAAADWPFRMRVYSSKPSKPRLEDLRRLTRGTSDSTSPGFRTVSSCGSRMTAAVFLWGIRCLDILAWALWRNARGQLALYCRLAVSPATGHA